jgi:drug/metabolite transporter (DMT)-like permease
MTIVDNTKFLIGVAFALAGVAVLVQSRNSRGFNQKRQAGAMLLIAAGLFVGIGLGLVDL